MTDHAYTAYAPCGCRVAVDFEDGPDAHANVADWIRRGNTVKHEPVPAEGFTFGCPHDPKWGRLAGSELPGKEPS